MSKSDSSEDTDEDAPLCKKPTNSADDSDDSDGAPPAAPVELLSLAMSQVQIPRRRAPFAFLDNYRVNGKLFCECWECVMCDYQHPSQCIHRGLFGLCVVCAYHRALVLEGNSLTFALLNFICITFLFFLSQAVENANSEVLFRHIYRHMSSYHLKGNRVIQMSKLQGPRLLTHNKRMTTRVWGPGMVKRMYECFKNEWLVRVWRGQGHKYTVGYMLITNMYPSTLGKLTKVGCALEGWPELTPGEFLDRFLLRSTPGKPALLSTPCTVCLFDFYPTIGKHIYV